MTDHEHTPSSDAELRRIRSLFTEEDAEILEMLSRLTRVDADDSPPAEAAALRACATDLESLATRLRSLREL